MSSTLFTLKPHDSKPQKGRPEAPANRNCRRHAPPPHSTSSRAGSVSSVSSSAKWMRAHFAGTWRAFSAIGCAPLQPRPEHAHIPLQSSNPSWVQTQADLGSPNMPCLPKTPDDLKSSVPSPGPQFFSLTVPTILKLGTVSLPRHPHEGQDLLCRVHPWVPRH